MSGDTELKEEIHGSYEKVGKKVNFERRDAKIEKELENDIHR